MVPVGWETQMKIKGVDAWEKAITEVVDADGESFVIIWKDMGGNWHTLRRQWDICLLEHTSLSREEAARCADPNVKLPMILLSEYTTHCVVSRVR